MQKQQRNVRTKYVTVRKIVLFITRASQYYIFTVIRKIRRKNFFTFFERSIEKSQHIFKSNAADNRVNVFFYQNHNLITLDVDNGIKSMEKYAWKQTHENLKYLKKIRQKFYPLSLVAHETFCKARHTRRTISVKMSSLRSVISAAETINCFGKAGLRNTRTSIKLLPESSESVSHCRATRASSSFLRPPCEINGPATACGRIRTWTYAKGDVRCVSIEPCFVRIRIQIWYARETSSANSF